MKKEGFEVANKKKKIGTKKNNVKKKKSTAKKKTSSLKSSATKSTNASTKKSNTQVKGTSEKKSTTTTKKKTNTTPKKKTNKSVKKKSTTKTSVNTKPIVKDESVKVNIDTKRLDEINKDVTKTQEIILPKEIKTTKTKKSINKSNAKTIEKKKKSNDFTKSLNKLIRKIRMYGITSVIKKPYLIGGGVFLGLLLVFLLIIPMLFKNPYKMDLTLIPDKIDQLKTISFNIDDSNDIVSSSNAFSGLKDYYEYDFESVFELNKDFVEEYVIKYNNTNKQAFIVIKSTNGHFEDIKNTFDKFFASNSVKDYEYVEYQGYQIYINSTNNALVLSKIRQSEIRVFNILQEIKKSSDIESILGVKEAYYDEALVKLAMLKTDTCGYIIFKPSNSFSKSRIISAMDEYFANLENKWLGNNEENYNLVVNRTFEEYNDYLIYVISYDNNIVMQLIKG